MEQQEIPTEEAPKQEPQPPPVMSGGEWHTIEETKAEPPDEPYQSQELDQLARALSRAQRNLEAAPKSSKNPFYNASYADLSTCLDSAREALASEGLSVAQPTRLVGDRTCLETRLMHESGQWIRGILPIVPMRQIKDKGWVPSKDPQAVGSAITYARRYAFCAMVGVSQADDDGEGAMGRGGSKALGGSSATKRKSTVEMDH